MDIELLAPAKNTECLKAVIDSGADSVYMGYDKFNARMFGNNFSIDDFKKGIKYAHSRNVRVYLTLNTLVFNDEFEDAVSYAEQAITDGIDGIITQDIGLARAIHEGHKNIPLHASTQMTISNRFGMQELQKLGFRRVILARELNIDEISSLYNLTNQESNQGMEIEFFIHGGLCIAYSGQCYSSSVLDCSSANRGLCKMPCWENYTLYCDEEVCETGTLIRPKDLCGLPEITKLKRTDFSKICLKIQGRLRPVNYIAEVVTAYRNAIDSQSLFSDLLYDAIWDKLLSVSPRGLTLGNLPECGVDNLIMKSDQPKMRIELSSPASLAFSDLYKSENSTKSGYAQISIALHSVCLNYDYLSLSEAINHIYIPIDYFFDEKYADKLSNLCKERSVYAYMPSMILERNSALYRKIPYLLDSFNIFGFVLSNLSDLCLIDLCKGYSLDFVCNYTLNVTNCYTARFYQDKGIRRCTFGFDSNIYNMQSIQRESPLQFEQIVFGHIPLMSLKYCIPTHLNECHSCERHLCKRSLDYSLEGKNSFFIKLYSDPPQSVLFNKTPYYVRQEDWIGSTVRADFYKHSVKSIDKTIECLLDWKKNPQIDYIDLNEIF